MGRHIIQRVINHAQAFEDVEAIWSDPDSLIEVDFSRVEFAQAAGALIFSSGLQSLLRERPYAGIIALGVDMSIDAHSYLAHVGFFHHAGFELETPAGRQRIYCLPPDH